MCGGLSFGFWLFSAPNQLHLALSTLPLFRSKRAALVPRGEDEAARQHSGKKRRRLWWKPSLLQLYLVTLRSCQESFSAILVSVYFVTVWNLIHLHFQALLTFTNRFESLFLGPLIVYTYIHVHVHVYTCVFAAAHDITYLDPFLGPRTGSLYITDYKMYFKSPGNDKTVSDSTCTCSG